LDEGWEGSHGWSEAMTGKEATAGAK